MLDTDSLMNMTVPIECKTPISMKRKIILEVNNRVSKNYRANFMLNTDRLNHICIKYNRKHYKFLMDEGASIRDF